MKEYMRKTLEYYDLNWEEYMHTWNEDFVAKMDFKEPDIFLSHLKPNARILDLGCGSGRDTIHFKNLGYDVVPFDASKEMCKVVASLTGLEPVQMNFLDMKYDEEFDGVFATASLLHLNDEDLIACLKLCVRALKKTGIMYVSFKYGEGVRVKEGRYFNDMTAEKFQKIIENVPQFCVLDWWISDQFESHKQFISFIIKKN